MPYFVSLTHEDKEKLLDSARTNRDRSSWIKLAKYLGVSKSMLFAYKKKTHIPKARFFKLCKLAKLDPNNFKFSIIEIKNTPRKVKIPKKLDSKLSELLGIIAGDGHVSTLKYQVDVCGHKKLDKEFLTKHVIPLFEQVFGTTPISGERTSAAFCRIYSKAVIFFLSERFGVPLGEKKNKLRIPREVMKSPFLADYIRGLFDTDGSIYRHHQKDIALDITSISDNFRKDIAAALKKLGFSPTINGKNVQLYRQQEIRTFFFKIRPANRKHLIKYETFNKYGYLPKADELFAVVV